MGPDFSTILGAVDSGPLVAALLGAGAGLATLALVYRGVNKIKDAVFWMVEGAWERGAISRRTRDIWQDRLRF